MALVPRKRHRKRDESSSETSSSSSSSDSSSDSSSSSSSDSSSDSTSTSSSGSSTDSHGSDSDCYLSDGVVPQRREESRWDPIENRIKLYQQPNNPNIQSRAVITKTSPAKAYLKRVMAHARMARPGDEAQRAGVDNGPERPMPDKPVVPDAFANPEEANPVVEEAADGQIMCVVCLEREVKTMCLPCGQMVMCNVCSQQYRQWIIDSSDMAKCPTCRVQIKQITAVYGQVAAGSKSKKKKDKRHSKNKKKKKSSSSAAIAGQKDQEAD